MATRGSKRRMKLDDAVRDLIGKGANATLVQHCRCAGAHGADSCGERGIGLCLSAVRCYGSTGFSGKLAGDSAQPLGEVGDMLVIVVVETPPALHPAPTIGDELLHGH